MPVAPLAILAAAVVVFILTRGAKAAGVEPSSKDELDPVVRRTIKRTKADEEALTDNVVDYVIRAASNGGGDRTMVVVPDVRLGIAERGTYDGGRNQKNNHKIKPLRPNEARGRYIVPVSRYASPTPNTTWNRGFNGRVYFGPIDVAPKTEFANTLRRVQVIACALSQMGEPRVSTTQGKFINPRLPSASQTADPRIDGVRGFSVGGVWMTDHVDHPLYNLIKDANPNVRLYAGDGLRLALTVIRGKVYALPDELLTAIVIGSTPARYVKRRNDWYPTAGSGYLAIGWAGGYLDQWFRLNTPAGIPGVNYTLSPAARWHFQRVSWSGVGGTEFKDWARYRRDFQENHTSWLR